MEKTSKCVRSTFSLIVYLNIGLYFLSSNVYLYRDAFYVLVMVHLIDWTHWGKGPIKVQLSYFSIGEDFYELLSKSGGRSASHEHLHDPEDSNLYHDPILRNATAASL